jgi:hypothetical protein
MATVDFGKDISCTSSLKTGRYVTGARLVGEAIYRRLTTPRGMLRGGEEEADYGLDLVELIGSVATANDAAALEGRIQSEVLKDERVLSVDVTVTPTSTGPATEFVVYIEATTAAGPFNLKLSISELTVELVGLSVEG